MTHSSLTLECSYLLLRTDLSVDYRLDVNLHLLSTDCGASDGDDGVCASHHLDFRLHATVQPVHPFLTHHPQQTAN